jgi:hypothetical protein
LNKSSLRSPELLVLYVLIVLSIVASLVGFKKRFAIEARNKRVETVVDYQDTANLAVASQRPLDDVLRHIKLAGITSLALTEDTVDTLRTDGALTIQYESPYATTFLVSPSEPGLENRFEEALANKSAINYSAAGPVLTVDAPYVSINQLGLGLDPSQISATLRAGFYICPRLNNYPGATPQSINWMLQTAKDECAGKATTLIFTGLDVLGNRNNLHATADALANTGLRYGSVEFGKQVGDDILCRLAADHTVRVHSIGGNEMPTMDIPTAIGRFGLAARERSIRVCYIRFFLGGAAGEPNVLKTNLEFIHSIRETLTDGGLAIGPAHPYLKNPLPGRFWLVMMSLGVAAGGILLVRQFTGLTGNAFWAALGASIVLAAVLAMRSSTPIGRELLALSAAMSFPTLGLILFRQPPDPPQQRPDFASLFGALKDYALISGATFIGVLLVVGLLADRLFMIKVYEFLGIRLAVFTPIFLVAVYYGLNFESLPSDAPWADRWALIRKKWNELLTSPLKVGQVVLGVIGLAIIGIILLRSGNDPGIGVSSTELGFRAFLNKILSVRPRTKEFLFGHPMLIIGLGLAYSGKRKVLPLFLLAGAIGQASLLNTFCHIHTPLEISVLRAVFGLVLGGVFGAAAYLVIQRLIKSSIRRQTSAT